jgi:Eco57I restriction endonuclease.
MGSGGMNALVKKFAKDNYADAKTDLFACFIERGFTFAMKAGHNAMVTMQSWMFLSSFKKMRERMLREKTIRTMAHLGARSFGSISGEVVQTTSFVFQNKKTNGYKPAFFRLLEGGEKAKQSALLSGKQRFDTTPQDSFKKMPGSPVAYWISELVRAAFEKFPSLGNFAVSSNGVQTGDNNRFVRFWPEINLHQINLRWLPYNKGGMFRKWYGNIEHVIFWDDNGREIKAQNNSCIRGEEHYRTAGLTWSDVTSGRLAARFMPEGCIFDASGPSAFASDREVLYALMSLLNTSEVNLWSKI